MKLKAKPTKIKSRKQLRITSFDSRLFADLHKAKRPLPIKRLSERLDSSWKTTSEHVKKMERLGILKTKRSIRKTNVSINPELLNALRRKGRIK